jgi:disulfide bond formation protein DsbB
MASIRKKVKTKALRSKAVLPSALCLDIGDASLRLSRLRWLLSGGVALGGVYAAGRQSWMQLAEDAVECGFGDPTLVERLVDWLGGLWPSMFMATGLCKDKDWVFLGLTLANWSGIAFLMLAGASAWMLFRGRNR